MTPFPALSTVYVEPRNSKYTVELDANVVAVPRLRFAYEGMVRRGHTYVLRTPFRDLNIYVSDGGRSVRVWDETAGRELK